jgi:hypothetical protein
MTAGRVTNLYDLMDSAYDAPEIDAKSRALGHVPIIDRHPRSMPGGKEDDFGARYVRVRGHAKVFCHLMFGVLALTIDQLMRLVT